MSTKTTNTNTDDTPAQVGFSTYYECNESGDVLAVATAFNGTPIRRLVIAELADNIRAEALAHGLKQKLADAYASAKTKGNVWAMDNVESVADSIASGTWARRRAGGTSSDDNLTVAAIKRAFSPADAATLIGRISSTDATGSVKLDKAAAAAVRALPRVAPHVAAIQAERAASRSGGVDVDSLLAGLSD